MYNENEWRSKDCHLKFKIQQQSVTAHKFKFLTLSVEGTALNIYITLKLKFQTLTVQ